MNKLGFHIMDAQAAQSDWIPQFRSAVHLMLAIGAGGEVPQTAALCANNPNSRIIYRAWSYGDVGQSDHFDWYMDKYCKNGATVQPLLDKHEGAFKALAPYRNQVSYQIFNETGHDEHLWPMFIEVNKLWVQALDARGLSASTLGMGPGHPAREGRENLRKAWTQARPLFEAIDAARGFHLINLHEYHAVPYTRFVPWVIGRYKMMLEDIALMGLLTPKIQVVIGESGFTDPNALGFQSPTGPNGYQWSLSQGHSVQDLVNDYMTMMQREYEPNPHLFGVCYFGFGDGIGWKEFDLLSQPDLLKGMYAKLNHNPQSGGDPPVPVIVIDTPVIPFDVLTKLNVRAAPSTSAVIVTTLAGGTVVPTNGYADANGYRWRRRVEGGYCAQYPLDNPAAAWLSEHTNETWKVEALARLADITSTVEALTALVDSA